MSDKVTQPNEQYETTKFLAALVIRDKDPQVIDLVAHTTFVSVYVFNDSSKEWSRADVEGFLFIVRRAEDPEYRLLILNQRNQSNLSDDIDSSWEITHEQNYIFYRRRGPNGLITRGLWFFDDSERERILGHLHRIRQNIKEKANGINIRSNGSVDYPPPANNIIRLQPEAPSTTIMSGPRGLFKRNNDGQHQSQTSSGNLNNNNNSMNKLSTGGEDMIISSSSPPQSTGLAFGGNNTNTGGKSEELTSDMVTCLLRRIIDPAGRYPRGCC